MRPFLFALSVLFMLSLAACGGGSGGGAPDVGEEPDMPAPVPPSITAVTAKTTFRGVAAGLEQGGTVLTISGEGFAQGEEPQVLVGDTEVTPTVVDDRTLRATTPPGSAGLVAVRVLTSLGDASMSDAFEYREPRLFFAYSNSQGIRIQTHVIGTGGFPTLGDPIPGYRIQALAVSPDGVLLVAAIEQVTVEFDGTEYVVDGDDYFFDVDQETGVASNFRESTSAQRYQTRGLAYVDTTPVGFFMRRGVGTYPPGTIYGSFGRIEGNGVTEMAAWSYSPTPVEHGGLANVDGRLYVSGELSSGAPTLIEVGQAGQSLRLVSTGKRHHALASLGGKLYASEYVDGDQHSRLVEIDPESGDVTTELEDTLYSVGPERVLAMTGNIQ